MLSCRPYRRTLIQSQTVGGLCYNCYFIFMLRARLNRCDSGADMIDINVYNYLFMLAVYLLV